jgi:hypothetical protein
LGIAFGTDRWHTHTVTDLLWHDVMMC